MQFELKIIDYVNFKDDKRKEIIDEICRNNGIDKVFEVIRRESHGADPLMYVLIDLAKRLRGEMKVYKNDIVLLLHNDNPKVRTKALRVIKLIDSKFFIDDIIDAFEKEETMFTYPDYIRVIAMAKNEKAESFLNSYAPRSTGEKHLREEKEALNKAKARFIKCTKAQPKINECDSIWITAPNLNVVRNEFFKLGVTSKIEGKFIKLRHLINYDEVFRVRAFSNAYIHLGICPSKRIPEFIKHQEERIIERAGVNNYRLEIRGVSHKDRIKLISDTAVKNKILINAPSAYSFELFADVKDNLAHIFLNPLTDNRFAYRKESVPASITGAGAASVCAFASEYFKPYARVLDNFCGSGTMLFERGFYKHGKLIGADINKKAIKAAKINSKAAEAHPVFIHMDALKFRDEQFDEVITNMPFGLRVGNHDKNEKLYKNYIAMLPSILSDNGIAVLYTQEKKLLEKMLHEQPALKLLKKGTFEAGGLTPSAYILQKVNL